MALNTAYDSKINKHFNKKNIILAIKKGHHTADETSASMGNSIMMITDSYEVTPLPYPLYDGESDSVYVDVRSATSVDRGNTLKIRSQPDFEFLELLSRLELKWVREKHTSELQSGFSYTNDIFINWLTELIAYKLSLSPIHTMRLRALTAFYIVGLFNNHPEKAELERYAALLSRKFAVGIEVCYEVLDIIGGDIPTNVESYVDAIQVIGVGTRVKDFSTRALFNFLTGSFIGINNPSSFVAVAIEYPPAFAAICIMTERYKFMGKSSIGKTVEYANKKNRSTVSKGMRQLLMEVGIESDISSRKITLGESASDTMNEDVADYLNGLSVNAITRVISATYLETDEVVLYHYSKVKMNQVFNASNSQFGKIEEGFQENNKIILFAEPLPDNMASYHRRSNSVWIAGDIWYEHKIVINKSDEYSFHILHTEAQMKERNIIKRTADVDNGIDCSSDKLVDERIAIWAVMDRCRIESATMRVLVVELCKSIVPIVKRVEGMHTSQYKLECFEEEVHSGILPCIAMYPAKRHFEVASVRQVKIN